VRLRISRQFSGSIDGIDLDGFLVGFVYDVGLHLACYLLAEQYAEPVDDESAALVTAPWSQVRFDIPPPTRPAPLSRLERSTVPLRAVAADRGRRRAKKSR
jgi:hypothetical protein